MNSEFSIQYLRRRFTKKAYGSKLKKKYIIGKKTESEFFRY
jgi:hypothetical protein